MVEQLVKILKKASAIDVKVNVKRLVTFANAAPSAL
jgi:hypothetical protein